LGLRRRHWGEREWEQDRRDGAQHDCKTDEQLHEYTFVWIDDVPAGMTTPVGSPGTAR